MANNHSSFLLNYKFFWNNSKFYINFYILYINKQKYNMKNWNWKNWTSFGIIVATLIAGFICHLVQPQVSYAWMEIVSALTFALGGITGYLIGKDKTPVQINS